MISSFANIELKNYLSTLKKKQHINNLYETAIDDTNYGNISMAPREKSNHEVLQDVVEVQQRVNKFLRDTKLFNDDNYIELLNNLTDDEYIFIFTNENLIKTELLGKYKVLSYVEFKDFLIRLQKKITESDRVSDLPSLTKNEVETILKDLGLDRLSDSSVISFKKKLEDLGYDDDDIDNIIEEYTSTKSVKSGRDDTKLEMIELKKTKTEGVNFPYIDLTDERLLNVIYRLDGTIRDNDDEIFANLVGPLYTINPIADLKKEFYYRINDKPRSESIRINAIEIKELFYQLKTYNSARRMLSVTSDTSEAGESASGPKLSGKGIVTRDKKKERYTEFGKKHIHLDNLEKNIVNVKYPRGHYAVPNLQPVKINDDLKEFFQDVIENKKVNEPLFKKLSKEDQKTFIKTASRCGMKQFDIQNQNYEKESEARFELLKGQISSGNDNKEIIKEFKELLTEFINCNKIKVKQGIEILSLIK